jgi:hypothetical protein
VTLPEGADEAALCASARRRGIALDGVGEHALLPQPAGLVLGFAALPEPTLARAIRALGHAARPTEIAQARARIDSTRPRVVENRGLRRYELWVGERIVGLLSCTRTAGVVAMRHVEIEPGDHDWAGLLVRGALDDVRAQGWHVRPVSPLVAAIVQRHPQYADLVR